MTPLIVFAAIAVLLVLILKFRMPAYLALLLVSLLTGVALGMETDAVITAVQNGMGGTLGFVAVVVGLGAMLGALLEYSGGVHALALGLLARTGTAKAPWVLSLVGLLISIPVFLDVAFIILVPLLYSLARDSGKSVLFYAIPTLAGLLLSHAFIPPTPGPLAVAELLQADLGLVILFGLVCGIPPLIVGGPLLARRWRDLPTEAFLLDAPADPQHTTGEQHGDSHATLSLAETLVLILLPLVLIVTATVVELWATESTLVAVLSFLGHPFTALALVTLLAFILLRARGAGDRQLGHCLGAALEPAGVVVLVTGAGGVFKQVLTDSGAGLIMAEAIAGTGVIPVVFAFLVALLVRVSQGSATVAMITAAGLVAPLQESLGITGIHSALLVVAIAAGASAFSHVNDSGFWLVSRYLNMDTRQTLLSWTLMSVIVGCGAFVMVLLLSLVL